jgi:site-specific DNA recombinase
VDVAFVQAPRGETPEDVLVLQFQGMIAEYEKAQISERTRRGNRHRARCGVVNVLSAAPYRYRYVRKADRRARATRSSCGATRGRPGHGSARVM